MRQLLQDVSSGELSVREVPAPVRGPGALLVATRRSLISAGTERALVELGRKSLVGKARARPDLARKVVESAREEGTRAAYDKVRGRLGQPTALGYSSCGVVLEAPADAPAGPGELVVCAGQGYASHAELVAVPRLLCARVPEGVDPEDAAYATVASIALHGVRLTGAGLGDVGVVIGLGLVGQLTLELLAAAGCVALGLDPSPERAGIAQQAGFWATTDPADLLAETGRRTRGRGADAVLVTAASTTPAPLSTGIEAARERATVCLVGDVPVQSPRAPLFAKEVRLVVSRSYGPGRYDPAYEEAGHDYPAGYVRWTEGRNLEEVVRLMASGALRPSRLTTHRFDLPEGPQAYELLEGDEPSLGIVLRYAEPDPPSPRTLATGMPARRRRIKAGRPRVGVVGAGTFARTVLLPQLARHADVATVVTATGPSAMSTARHFGAGTASTDPAAAFEDPTLDAILIATRHDTHAAYSARALRAGKHVFVEKPLALDETELRDVEAALSGSDGGSLSAGFNRRHAPLARDLRRRLGGRGPMLVQIRVNAGRVPRNHWVHDPVVGGGRIVGEVCHFVDLAAFLCDGQPAVVAAIAVDGTSEPRDDTLAATLRFADGSVATIAYSALGDPQLEKERVEVLGEAGAGVLEDFRELRILSGGEAEVVRGRRDKGHAAQVERWVESIRTGVPSQSPEELLAVMRATFAIRAAVEGHR